MPSVIDLFCGAGGLSEGFRQAGFDVLAGNDLDAGAGKTFRSTHRHATFFEGPIDGISVREMLAVTGLRRGELDCLVGGPPCQAYSVYNHQRGMHDERSGLFREYLRMVEGIHPKWIVLENVTGITSVGGGQAVKEIVSNLSKLGYDVDFKILRAEEYGVPQERRRIVFIGNRVGAPIQFPRPTHGIGGKPFVTIAEAICDLPPLANGAQYHPDKYQSAPQSEFQRQLRRNSKTIHNHAAPKLSSINLKRMKHIPQGGSWRDIPVSLLPEGMKRARRCDHTKRYGRMHPEGLACTILTKCDLHWGAYIHPEQDRVITVREAARIQTFPDTFVFEGSRTEQYVQVGNAVPPMLAKRIAETISLALSTYTDKRASARTKTNAELRTKVA